MTPNNKRIVGLTGGIASGKSTVSQLLAGRVAIVDADVIARQVVKVGQPAYQKIVAYFGERILLADRQINRKALGAIVFGNQAARRALEAITHPAISAQIERRIADLRADAATPFILLDAALLFEVGLDRLCDVVWLVAVTKDVQIKRLCQRDKLSIEAARRMVDSQMPLREKRRRADVIIDNNQSLAALARQVESLYKAEIEAIQ